MDIEPLLTGAGVLVGGISLNEIWRAWQARRGKTERHRETLFAGATQGVIEDLRAQMLALATRETECQRNVLDLSRRIDQLASANQALLGRLEREETRNSRLMESQLRILRRQQVMERQLRQAGIDVDTEDVAVEELSMDYSELMADGDTPPAGTEPV